MEPQALENKESPTPSGEIMKFFKYEHLPEKLQKVSRPFGELAIAMKVTLPENDEKYHALRKLLEAKDCAVRSLL